MNPEAFFALLRLLDEKGIISVQERASLEGYFHDQE